MRPATIVAAGDNALKGLFPELPRPEHKTLAALVPAVVRRGTSHLSRLGAAMAGRATNPSKARRVQRLLANPRLDLARTQRRVIAHLLRHRRGRLDLALDATLIGATAAPSKNGVVTLLLAMAWHGRAIPLAWCCLPEKGAQPGQWMPAIRAVVQRVAAELPAGLEVVVLTDRGLSGATLASILAEVGWHVIQRVTVRPNVRLGDGTMGSVGSRAPRPGCPRVLSGGATVGRPDGALARWPQSGRPRLGERPPAASGRGVAADRSRALAAGDRPAGDPGALPGLPPPQLGRGAVS